MHPQSSSGSTLETARRYVTQQIEELRLTAQHLVVEVGGKDGYLLHYFVRRGIPVLGIETNHFNPRWARALRAEGLSADLLIGNHVLATVRNVDDFMAAMKLVLAPRGVITVEFPHVLHPIGPAEMPYSSLRAVTPLFARNGLTIYDADEVGTDSLRIFGCHSEDPLRPISPRVASVEARERHAGLHTADH